MDTTVIKNNNSLSDGKKKILKIAVAALCVLSALLIVFLACKNTVFFRLAQKNALEGKYRIATAYASESTDTKAKMIAEYVSLRVSINEKYPDMLAELDREVLNEWYASACLIIENPSYLASEIIDTAFGIKQTLEMIFERLDSYETLRPTILSAMDVFNEINRLYTKDADGKNISFTIEEEYKRITAWEQQNILLHEYLSATPNGESIYLFNFLVKEIDGECSDLILTFNTVFENGYASDDIIRFSGSAKKTFPDVQNGNVILNVLDKVTYEEYLYKGLCRSLVENLLKYFQ